MNLHVYIPEINKTYAVRPGHTLLEVMQHHRVDISSPCGGKGTCKKCLVQVDKLGQVLACQLKINEELWQKLDLKPDESLVAHLPEKTHAQFAAGGTLPSVVLNPIVCRAAVTLSQPSLADPRPDDGRFETATGMKVPLHLLNDLNKRLSNGNSTINYDFRTDTRTVVRFVEKQDTLSLGVAVDVGTTTLAAYLYDLSSGKKLAQTSRLNPQKSFGADVISRIEYASVSAENLSRLQSVLIDALVHMIKDLVVKADAARLGHFEVKKCEYCLKDILVVTLAGNTTMMHLLSGLNPVRIALAPFIPVSLQGRVIGASEIGLNLNPIALAVLLPSVGSYVGADITAGVLACGLQLPLVSKPGDKPGSARVLLDIGTNGEIVLSGPNGLVACATAAGPAFEGSNIACGMPALTGAIDQVSIEDGQLSFSSIGGTVTGICGSGLVALISTLLEAGVIDETGRLFDADELDDLVSEDIKNRLGVIGQQKVFYLSDHVKDMIRKPAGEKSSAGEMKSPPVYLCQKDIRELQNAKAALAAGLQVLINKAGLKVEDLKELSLAGGFGNYLNIEQAIRIGLLPESLCDKIKVVGNSSGIGASMCLLDDNLRLEAAKAAQTIHYVELSGDPLFTDLYIDAMIFPEV